MKIYLAIPKKLLIYTQVVLHLIWYKGDQVAGISITL